MKAYKGFNRDMTCRGFQYEEGKTYHEEEAILCQKGFHACENPLDTFRFYSPGTSVFREVELYEVTEKNDYRGTKLCAKTIYVGDLLSASDLCYAHAAFVRKHCDPQNKHFAVGNQKSVAAGEHGFAMAGVDGSATAGDGGSAAAGINGHAVAGDFGSAVVKEDGCAVAGFGGIAVADIHGCAVTGSSGMASAGSFGCAVVGDLGSATASNSGRAVAGQNGCAIAGNFGTAVTEGADGSASTGYHGLACCRGGAVKGDFGAVLVGVELNRDGTNLSCAAAIVDGKTIKENTWYRVKDGNFVEVENNAR